jgi:hypothetical protein
MSKASKLMLAYGLFLVAGALVAISISGWDRSKTALFSSGGAAALMAAMAFMASAKAKAPMMIGIHLGMALPLVFAATFGWRLSLNWAKPSPEEWLAANPGLALDTSKVESGLQNWLFPLFIVGSVAAFFLILTQRPKPGERGEALSQPDRP